MKKIVTIGGGSGSPVVLKSLLLAGYKDISAISTSTDSGGKTGFIRSDERDRVIAISDLLRNLLALIPDKKGHKTRHKAFLDLVTFTDGRNRNLGYTIYYALLEKYGNDFSLVQQHLEKLLSTKFHGQAIPVSTQPANITFKTLSGDIFNGEHELDRLSMSKNTVSSIWLEPQVDANPKAIKAIQEADVVVVCPGSLYGSILVNFLPNGVKQAYNLSQASKILITNLVSDRNQTHNFTPIRYLNFFKAFLGTDSPFNYVISPNIDSQVFQQMHPLVVERYAYENSHFLGTSNIDRNAFKKEKISLIESDNYSVTKKLNRIRHDPLKMAKTLREIIG